MQLACHSVERSERPTSEGGSVSHPPVVTASNLETNDDSANATNGLYMTITDQQSGQYAVVSTNREIVTLKDKSGKMLWESNIVQAIGNEPLSGERKIRGMQLFKGDLWVSVGRGYAIVDIKSGRVNGTASN